jgi:hypothetical protein
VFFFYSRQQQLWKKIYFYRDMENSKQIMSNIDSYLKDLINSIYIVIPSGSEASQGQWFF